MTKGTPKASPPRSATGLSDPLTASATRGSHMAPRIAPPGHVSVQRTYQAAGAPQARPPTFVPRSVGGQSERHDAADLGAARRNPVLLSGPLRRRDRAEQRDVTDDQSVPYELEPRRAL